MRKNDKLEIQVQVVVIPSKSGLVFDLIDSDHCIKRFELDDYELRQFRGSERDVIQALIERYVEDVIPYGQDYVLRVMFR